MTQQRLTPEWQQLRDAFEQCGYKVSHHRDYLTDSFEYFSARDTERILTLHLTIADHWNLVEIDEENAKPLALALTAGAARAAALRWLEAQHGTLDFTPRLNRLTAEQRRTFSREWNALIDGLAARGWRVSWRDGWGELNIAKADYLIRARLHHGRWVLAFGQVRTEESFEGTDESARTVLFFWTLGLDGYLQQREGESA